MDRHWKQLMEKTGISFDIDPLTFTLEGVFAMELHHYSEVIAIIVANAQRELVIEQVRRFTLNHPSFLELSRSKSLYSGSARILFHEIHLVGSKGMH